MVVEALRRERHAHALEHLDRLALRFFLPDGAMPHDPLDDLVADGERRIERRHRLLEDHRDAIAADVAQRRGRQAKEVGAFEEDFAGGHPARARDEAHDRERGHALAAARFADEAERAAGSDVEIDAVDGGERSRFGREGGREAATSSSASTR
jgi:hypothetical protein